MAVALGRRFFARPALDVAVDLLGTTLVSEQSGARVVVAICEVEAYTQDDPASHSFRGRTPRNEVMFRPPGHLYVYFTYGMHWCANVVTGKSGVGEAVLLRAATVVEGATVVRSRRGPKPPERRLLDGPAKLAQGLGLAGRENGIDLCSRGSSVYLRSRDPRVDDLIYRSTPRVGISKAVDRPWRFVLVSSDTEVRGPAE